MPRILKKLEDNLLAFLQGQADVRGRGGLVVAWSGGLDSTALLHLLLSTADRHGRPLSAAHINHAVRPDADREEARLRREAATLGVPFLAWKNPTAYPPDSPPSEAKLRRVRYRILRRMAEENVPPAWVLLAHQRDDQAETVLMNLARGAGLPGLAGMRSRRSIFLRPLLETPRSVLRRYLEEIGVEWVEDPTNRDLRYTRNRIRHLLLPAMEKEVRPKAKAAIARASRHLAAVLDLLDAEAARCLALCRVPAPAGELRLDARMFATYPEALSEHLLRKAVCLIQGGTRDIPASTWQAMLSLQARGKAGRLRLSSRVVVEVSPRIIRIAAAGREASGFSPMEVPVSGSLAFPPGGSVSTERIERRDPLRRIRIRGLNRMQAFDADSIHPPARIRLPRKGDRIRIAADSGSRKLVDLLSERAIPRSVRSGQPVLEDREGILWLPGIRRADRARIGPNTKRIWVVRWSGPLPAEAALTGGETKR